MAITGHNTRPVSDDQVSVGSYSSDAYTLPCRAEDDTRSAVSHDSFDSWCPEEDLPSYRVPEEQGVSQPVYEAWVLYYSDNQDRVKTTSFCGLTVSTRIKEPDPYVSCHTETYEQEELSSMTADAVQRYMGANKRCLPSRLIRGRAKSYERDLDDRILKLPRPVQSELDYLLADRESASSNRFHRRDWTVTMMREQCRFRFASSEFEEVKKSKRFWNKDNKRSTAYFFILCGREGKIATDDKGLYRARRQGNPWKRVDEIERTEKQQARNMRRFGQKTVPGRMSDYRVRSPDRPVSPSPSSPPRRVRVERVERDEGSEADETWYPPPNPFVSHSHLGGYGMHPPIAPPPGPFGYCPPPPPGPFYYPPPPPPPPAATAAFPRVVPYAHPGLHYPPPPPTSIPSRPMSAFADFDRPHPPLPPMSPLASDWRDSSRMPLPSESSVSSRYPEAFSMPPYSHPSFFNFAGRYPVPPQYTRWSQPSPPPAPRLSNLTTPATFSPATTNPTGSSIDQTEISTPVDADNVEFRERLPSGTLFGRWGGPRAESVISL